MKTPVTIVHDLSGQIVGIVRNGDPSRYTVVTNPGQAVLQLELEDDNIPALVHTHRVDITKRALIKNAR